jgi:hypothetical protein
LPKNEKTQLVQKTRVRGEIAAARASPSTCPSPDANTACRELQPGDDCRGEVALDNDHLVAVAEAETLSEQVESVAGGIAEHDLTRLAADQIGQPQTQALGDLPERLVSDPRRHDLAR